MNLFEDKDLIKLAATLRRAKARALEAQGASLAANEAADEAIKALLTARREEEFAAKALSNALEQRFRYAFEELAGD